MNKGDEVTINGIVIFVNGIQAVVETKGGRRLFVREEDINTIRPKIVIPDKDERRGK